MSIDTAELWEQLRRVAQENSQLSARVSQLEVQHAEMHERLCALEEAPRGNE